MAIVEVRDSELLEEALKRFRKTCEREGISREIKKRSFYEKPSMKKKKKKEVRERKLMKKLRKLKAKGLIS